MDITPGKGFLNKWTLEEVRSFFQLNPNLSDQEVEEIRTHLNSNDLVLNYSFWTTRWRLT
jgi:hypothetical protein